MLSVFYQGVICSLLLLDYSSQYWKHQFADRQEKATAMTLVYVFYWLSSQSHSNYYMEIVKCGVYKMLGNTTKPQICVHWFKPLFIWQYEEVFSLTSLIIFLFKKHMYLQFSVWCLLQQLGQILLKSFEMILDDCKICWFIGNRHGCYRFL